MAINKLKENNQGIALVEVIIVVSIIGIALVSLMGLATYSVNVITLIKHSDQAKALARETIEAVRNFRDTTTWSTDGLGTLTTDADYHPEVIIGVGSSTWSLVASAETIGIFTRKVIFNNVSRDPTTKDIETTYNLGNDDSNSRRVVVTVTWENKNMEIISYLTNWQQ